MATINDDGVHPAHYDGLTRKRRRNSRACLQCRSRKQKCHRQGEDIMSTCQRCNQDNVECSFAVQDESMQSNITAASTLQKVRKLQSMLHDHQTRIMELERSVKSRTVVTANIEQPPPSPESTSVQSGSDSALEANHERREPTAELVVQAAPSYNIDDVDLNPPMTTLRTIANSAVRPRNASGERTALSFDRMFTFTAQEDDRNFEQDPVARRVLSVEDAVEAFRIFFQYCHSHAPFLDVATQSSAQALRQSSPTLFLSICVIGTRFWSTADRALDYQGLHKRYHDLVTLLDTSIARLLLRPTSRDVNIDNIRSLLLYIQWMPVEQYQPGVSRTRYNDTSAWSVLGLAIRYAQALGLDRRALQAYHSVSIQESMAHMPDLRVWINLLTCDCHLMLSAGLPSSLDAGPAARLMHKLTMSASLNRTSDLRFAAICQLVHIVQKAAHDGGERSIRRLDLAALRRVNLDLDDWDAEWAARLGDGLEQNQMPFTTLRWYRLAVNSACLSSMFSSPHTAALPLLEALDCSVLAAAQTLLALSSQCTWESWRYRSSSIDTFPIDNLTVDGRAISSFRFSVEIAWVTHSFAAIFLVLAYRRGVIADNLTSVRLAVDKSSLVMAPAVPRSESLFFRLITLAADIFETVGQTTAAHPAADYRTMITSLFSAVLSPHVDHAATSFETADLSALFGWMQDADAGWSLGTETWV